MSINSDSLGATARYGRGDVQWLTAGAGIQHAEMFPLVFRDQSNPLELFQIWLNLPARSKMADPYFTMFWGDGIPRHDLVDSAGRRSTLTTIAGRWRGVSDRLQSPPPDSWAAQPEADVAIWTLAMETGAQCQLPPGDEASHRDLYFFSGAELAINGTAVSPGHRISVACDRELTLTAGASAVELLLLQGRPIGEPVVQHGPFVMNTRDEITAAIRDYRRTQFGGWPWGQNDPVHARERTRFAKHADGRIEEPSPA